jgi:hypothetical protein
VFSSSHVTPGFSPSFSATPQGDKIDGRAQPCTYACLCYGYIWGSQEVKFNSQYQTENTKGNNRRQKVAKPDGKKSRNNEQREYSYMENFTH